MLDYGPTLDEFEPTMRVEFAPHTAAWMQGDRYGEVLKVTRSYVAVCADRSGKVRRVRATSIHRVIAPENLPTIFFQRATTV